MMSKKPLPRLTDAQRALCDRCYPHLSDIERAVLWIGLRKGKVLDAEAIRTRLHDRLMRDAGNFIGTDPAVFEQLLLERKGAWISFAYSVCISKAKQDEAYREELEDVHFAPATDHDPEEEMDRLGVTEERDAFEQVAWHGVSVNRAYGGEKWKWKRTRAAVEAVLEAERVAALQR